jgi:hypothetical protein
MEKKIFYDGKIWKGFEAPEKPAKIVGSPARWIEYHQAYAEAKRNALPIINPEFLDTLIDTLPFPTNRIIRLRKENEEFVWPGSWEVKYQYKAVREVVYWTDCHVSVWQTLKDKKGLTRKVIVLSLPEPVKPESKTKTAEEFNLPAAAVFQIQMIALADDEMVKKPDAAEAYRKIARHILELFKKTKTGDSEIH